MNWYAGVLRGSSRVEFAKLDPPIRRKGWSAAFGPFASEAAARKFAQTNPPSIATDRSGVIAHLRAEARRLKAAGRVDDGWKYEEAARRLSQNPRGFPSGAKVLIDGRDLAIVRAFYPEGSSSYLWPHYKVDFVDGDRNVAVSVKRVGVEPRPEGRGKPNPGKFWHAVVAEPRCADRLFRTIRFGKGGILARVYRCGSDPMKVASILFPKEKYTARASAVWATRHKFPWKRVEG